METGPVMATMLDRNGIRVAEGDAYRVLPTLGDGSFDIIATDPPYNEVNDAAEGGGGLRPRLNKGGADDQPVAIPELAAEFSRIASSWVFVWCGFEQVSPWVAAFRALGHKGARVGAWRKTDPAPMNADKTYLSGIELCVIARHPRAPFNRFCAVPHWEGPSSRLDWHPTPKPPWLFSAQIDATRGPAAKVFDPFAGSFSSGVAVAELHRYDHELEYLGLDNTPDYVTKGVARIKAALARTEEARDQLTFIE